MTPKTFELSETALFLDFDGTLSPIVGRPEDAVIDEATRAALQKAHRWTGGALAILSGRRLESVDRMLAPLKFPAAGSHGMERRDAAGKLHRESFAPEELEGAFSRMHAFAETHGLLLERKHGAVTLHFRSHPERGDEVRRLTEAIAADASSLRPMHGNMISEVVIGGLGKGGAVQAFMREQPFAGRVPLAAGDDTTDEDAFRTAQELGGLGIKVGPGPTAARCRAADIGAFLNRFHACAETGRIKLEGSCT